MKNSKYMIFGFVLPVIVVSLFIVSLITAGISLSAKLIICFFVVLLILIIYSINDLIDTHAKSHYFLRNIYISVETQRLDPENVTPSRDILAEDIRSEINYKDIEKSIMGFRHYAINVFGIIFYLLPIAICTLLLFYYWDQINDLLSSLMVDFHKTAKRF